MYVYVDLKFSSGILVDWIFEQGLVQDYSQRIEGAPLIETKPKPKPTPKTKPKPKSN